MKIADCGKMGLHLIKNPAGTFSFVGSVPIHLSYTKADGSRLDADLIQAIHIVGPSLVRQLIQTRTFKTEAEALDAYKLEANP